MKIEFLVIAAVVLVLITIVPTFDDEPQQTHDLYCEMVEIHKDTGGEYGWSDYNQNYDEVCK